MNKGLYSLKIDDEFIRLIRPLNRNEYLQLEANILSDGCIDPIIVWNGIIVDGHNRYKICRLHRIPFNINEKNFDSREEVKIWICEHQLGRRNISEETRKFLIGIQYENQKRLNCQRNFQGNNQYSINNIMINSESKITHKTAEKIGKENNVSSATVEKYAAYSKAINTIGDKVPEIMPKILSGQYKMSHKTVLQLSEMPKESIKKINNNLDKTPDNSNKYRGTKHEVVDYKEEEPTSKTIKDMPEYDPDSEIVGLTLTIPSWISSIQRTKEKAKWDKISSEAKVKLNDMLNNLTDTIVEILILMEEHDNA